MRKVRHRQSEGGRLQRAEKHNTGMPNINRLPYFIYFLFLLKNTPMSQSGNFATLNYEKGKYMKVMVYFIIFDIIKIL